MATNSSNSAKFRPSLTLEQIKALIQAASYDLSYSAETSHHDDLEKARKVLALTEAKANLGAINPSYVPTGTKPGRPSLIDSIKSDLAETQKPSYSTPEDWHKAWIDWNMQVELGGTPDTELAQAASNWDKHCQIHGLNIHTGKPSDA